MLFPQGLEALVILDLQTHPSNSLFHRHMSFPLDSLCVSSLPFLSLILTTVIEFRAHSTSRIISFQDI